METITVRLSDVRVTEVPMDEVLVRVGLAPSKTAAQRLIEARAVEVVLWPDDGEPVREQVLTRKHFVSDTFLIRCGRRWKKIALA